MLIKIYFEDTEYTPTGRNAIYQDLAEILDLGSIGAVPGLYCKEWAIVPVPDTQPFEFYQERILKLGITKVKLQSTTRSLQHHRATARDKPKRR